MLGLWVGVIVGDGVIGVVGPTVGVDVGFAVG
jgi:hypothetical protein